MHFILGSFAWHHAHHQTVFGVKSHMVPVVALVGIVRVLRVAVLLFFADERPLLIELDFVRLGGKEPRVRRGRGGRVGRRSRPGE